MPTVGPSLATSPRPPAAPGVTTLSDVAAGRGLQRRGSAGPAVRELQEALKARGFSLAVDGQFGPQTDAVVRAFQRANGLVEDGLVGPRTAAKLLAASTPKPPAPPAAPVDTFDPGPSVPAAQGLLPRSPGALTGTQFLEATKGMTRAQREQAILAEVAKGNVPSTMREWRELTVSKTLADGRVHTAKIRVLPDYLSIGSDADAVRIPMSPLTAQKAADLFGASLPTTKIVNEAFKQADVKLAPRPMTPGPQMMSSDYYLRHDATIDAQLGATEGLVAGHKKDVVLSNALAQRPGQVAIYGWHQTNGKPIQPLSTIHENTYADYSHGVRLVSNAIVVDGREMSLQDVMRDPVLSGLVTDEGRMVVTRVPGT